MFATAGNLDSYLLTRAHSPNPTAKDLTADELADAESLGQLPRAERIKAFKKRRQSSNAGNGAWRNREENRGVLMLGVEEIGKLFGDVVEGLAFLVRPTKYVGRVAESAARQFDPSPGSQMFKCSTGLGRGQTHVRLGWGHDSTDEQTESASFRLWDQRRNAQGKKGAYGPYWDHGIYGRPPIDIRADGKAPETLVTDTLGQWRPSDSHADMWSLGRSANIADTELRIDTAQAALPSPPLSRHGGLYCPSPRDCAVQGVSGYEHHEVCS
jgi:hypothetical protein